LTVKAFSNWLYKAIDDSRKPVPGTYPYPTNSGILHAAGFDETKVDLYDYRPSIKTLNLSKPSIVVEIMGWERIQKTSGGTNGELTRLLIPAVSVLWVADFAGQPGKGIAGEYSDLSVSQGYFYKLLNALEKTINLAVFQTVNLNVEGAATWPLVDPDTGDKSWVVAELPLIDAHVQPPIKSESAKNPQYIAWLECQFKEGFPVIQRS
jgi:hypothetical protein